MVDSVDLNIRRQNGRTSRTTVASFIIHHFGDGLIFIALTKMEYIVRFGYCLLLLSKISVD